jgi:Tol biopolymer transport system component
MSAARRSRGAALLALAAALLAAAPAQASFGPLRLVSKTATQQADSATEPVLSANGRYLAFRATNFLEGKSGVFWEELATGAVSAVHAGDASASEPLVPFAAAPSISADGRYVAFATAAALDPADDTVAGSVDVYVADMSATPPTYELASVAPGSTAALGGVGLAPRVALSADGRRVAFTSGGQVYLRDLEAGETTLVSVRRDPLSGGMEAGVPVPGGAVIGGFGAGAALSADGTTVAWLGAHVTEQVPVSGEEQARIAIADASASPYDEPLWRRVGDGPQAPTERVVGAAFDLPAVKHEEPPNEASGWLGIRGVDGVPQLSADGEEVALIGNPTEATNLFLASMAPGADPATAVRQLTAQVPVQPNEGSHLNRDPYIPLNGHVYDLAISPDGERVAFTTARQRFPLSPPNLVTPPPSTLGLVEAYVADLETESIARVSHGLGGETEASLGGTGEKVADGRGAASPSFGEGGRLLAFSSTAWNLVEGDGNGDAASGGADVFLGADESEPSTVQPQTISSPPPAARVRPRRRLRLSAFSLPDGSVKLVAVAPAAGRLQARAEGAAGGSGRRRLAHDGAPARAGKPVAMVLSLPRRYRPLAASREGLYATARVSFRSRSGAVQRARLQVRFQAHPKRGWR